MLFDPYAYDLLASATLPASALPDDALLDVPQAARDILWHGLAEAVAGAVDLWERLPAGHHSAPHIEMERRAGAWVAKALVRWELLLLRYRASPTLAPLVYD